MPLCGTHRSARAAAGVLVIALCVRLVHVWLTRDWPLVTALVGDAESYVRWARAIASGEWIGSEPFYQAPLYPYFLGTCFAIFGESIAAVRIVQAVVGASAAAITVLAASRLFGARAGLVAGLMLALYPPAIFFDGIIQKTTLDTLLISALGLGIVGYREGPTAWRAATAGALVAILALNRENALAWIPVLGAWVWFACRFAPWRLRLSRLAVFVAAVAIVFTPVVVRNRMLGGGWSVTTFQAGPNFYIGNHLGADGRYVPLVRGHESPEFERADATALAERAEGHALTPSEVSAFWMRRAREDIAADPAAWVRLLAWKFAMVWNSYEVADAESLNVQAKYAPVLAAVFPVWHFGVLCPLAAMGVAASWGRRRELWVWYALILTMAMAVTAFYVLGRYRYPLVPLLMPFGGAGVIALWEALRAKNVRRLGVAAVVAAIAALFVNWPLHDEARLDALAEMNVGVALARAGRVPAAVEFFKSAVRRHPESAEANYNLGQALASVGEFERALAHYQAALARGVPLPGLEYNMGVALERLGRREEAMRSYEAALRADQGDRGTREAIERLRSR